MYFSFVSLNRDIVNNVERKLKNPVIVGKRTKTKASVPTIGY
jgi:hypothetical protein